MEKLPAHAPVVAMIKAEAAIHRISATALAAAAFGDACKLARTMQGNKGANPSAYKAAFRMSKMTSHILKLDGINIMMTPPQMPNEVKLYKIAVVNCRTVLRDTSKRETGTECETKEAALDMVRMAQEAFIQIAREEKAYHTFPVMELLARSFAKGKQVTDRNLVRSIARTMGLVPCSNFRP